MSLRLTLRPRWSQRLLGAAVLLVVASGAVGLGVSGGAPTWTWVVLGSLGACALLATAANFGDSFEADDGGLSYENRLTGRLGWPPPRRAAWADVLAAVEQDGHTWFVEVEGQRRWVLDHLDGHDLLRPIFQQRGVSVSVRERPRPWRRPPAAR